ncbi:DUF4214 domain-containing protein [Roseomonas sp. BN140053]|uniref:DUF4214 domain-containing protein n=1 Tax=Roseomonas sp. BN140053 TaxID=3391898 RepID=UPI0039ECBA81
MSDAPEEDAYAEVDHGLGNVEARLVVAPAAAPLWSGCLARLRSDMLPVRPAPDAPFSTSGPSGQEPARRRLDQIIPEQVLSSSPRFISRILSSFPHSDRFQERQVTLVSGPNGYASINGWTMLTNAWNSGDLVFGEDYRLSGSFDGTSLANSAHFEWSFPENAKPWPVVRAYPDIGFGASPWGRGESDPSHVFPIQVRDLKTMTMDYSVQYGGDVGGYNVAYDIWFTTKPNGGVPDIKNELMIWLHKGDLTAFGQHIGDYAAQNFSGAIYNNGSYTAIVPDTDFTEGVLDLSGIIRKLQELHIISDDEYLTSVQLGAEVVEGAGSLSIRRMSLGIVDQRADGLVATRVTGAGSAEAGSLSYTIGVVPLLDSSGASIGFRDTSITESGDVAVHWYDGSSNFVGMDDLSIGLDGKVFVRHFDGSRIFSGAAIIEENDDASLVVREFDAKSNFLATKTIEGDGARGIALEEIVDSQLHFPDSQDVVPPPVGVIGIGDMEVQALARRDSSFQIQLDGTVVLTHGSESALLNGGETLVFADGRMVFDAADPAAQVVRLYNAALARGPEQAGLNYYIDALQHGRPLAEIAAGFNGSPEFQARYGSNLSLDAYLGQLYQNVLGRGASEAELQYYRDRAAAGDSRETLLVAFSESEENQARTAELVKAGIWDVSETAAQVARLYDTMFGRLPDLAGLRFYKDQLDAGTATLQGVVQSFTGSPEFQALYGTNPGSTEFVQLLYRNALDRSASPDEISHYVPKLAGDALSRADAVIGFSESPEHQALTAPDIISESHFGIAFV